MRIQAAVFRRFSSAAACAAALAVSAAAAPADAPENDAQKKPSVSVRSNPTFGFAPVRVVVTAEVKDGANDHEELYCPAIEWIWGDDTRSETKADCDPYEAGKSEIRRRYASDHTYHFAGTFQVEFWLKQKNKRVLGGKTTVTVRPGLRDGGN